MENNATRHSGVLHRESVFIDISGCLLSHINNRAVSPEEIPIISWTFCCAKTDSAQENSTVLLVEATLCAHIYRLSCTDMKAALTG